jgi:hypothetical protein
MDNSTQALLVQQLENPDSKKDLFSVLESPLSQAI